MACAVGDEDFKGEHKSKGLATNHAYTLIGAYQAQGNQLVKIRNPWGSYEWKGAWHDRDPRWTPQLKKEVGF